MMSDDVYTWHKIWSTKSVEFLGSSTTSTASYTSEWNKTYSSVQEKSAPLISNNYTTLATLLYSSPGGGTPL